MGFEILFYVGFFTYHANSENLVTICAERTCAERSRSICVLKIR